MGTQKSDTIEQQKRARREFLELKKMENGEIPTPPKNDTQSEKPTTVEGKIKNFWYHYKVQTLLALFLTAAMAVGISQCVKRPNYDLRAVVYTKNYYNDEQTAVFEKYLKQYATDINGDGVINVQIINCSYNKEDGPYDYDYVSSLTTKLQAVISSEGAVQLYIVDEDNFNALNSISDSITEFFTDYTDADASLYEIAEESEQEIPEGLIVGQRVTDGTLVQNTKNIELYKDNAKEIIEKIRAN